MALQHRSYEQKKENAGFVAKRQASEISYWSGYFGQAASYFCAVDLSHGWDGTGTTGTGRSAWPFLVRRSLRNERRWYFWSRADPGRSIATGNFVAMWHPETQLTRHCDSLLQKGVAGHLGGWTGTLGCPYDLYLTDRLWLVDLIVRNGALWRHQQARNGISSKAARNRSIARAKT
ncbi:hypothetical protein BO71DRAFT_443393 [Aspergillus ellipticus CBS 707.79]|uniref:Uncharacterized protein n=1 Tax=Aspergillus ellipticus CBS 707.79 TaxID=1448320 RepID=A0A319DSR4_9EURO|nr:hypothetical protein BO71DRAFT_443393 [Aspergillus ellipticus CBS 707.79]